MIVNIICAEWTLLGDGCVARCDRVYNHPDEHLDSVIAVTWEESIHPPPSNNVISYNVQSLLEVCARILEYYGQNTPLWNGLREVMKRIENEQRR